ncbi:MAG TPA: helix-turn-helix transcriptional regulator, partial [Polyangiaceae bacterium]
DDLAREARLSKFHLARCFREFTGLAPHQYQKLQRAQAARRFLERGASVQAAAEQAGFADGPHLTRTFREWLGVSPGAWARANHRIRSYAVLPRGALPRAER